MLPFLFLFFLQYFVYCRFSIPRVPIESTIRENRKKIRGMWLVDPNIWFQSLDKRRQTVSNHCINYVLRSEYYLPAFWTPGLTYTYPHLCPSIFNPTVAFETPPIPFMPSAVSVRISQFKPNCPQRLYWLNCPCS